MQQRHNGRVDLLEASTQVARHVFNITELAFTVIVRMIFSTERMIYNDSGVATHRSTSFSFSVALTRRELFTDIITDSHIDDAAGGTLLLLVIALYDTHRSLDKRVAESIDARRR